jgi:hypothetical protein
MFAIIFRRTIVADGVQGIIVGGLLAFFTANQITANRIIGFFTLLPERPISSGIVQSIFIDVALAYITTNLILDDEVKAVRPATTSLPGLAGRGRYCRA